MWVKMELPFLTDVIAESMWRDMGWVCDGRLDAVINTLKQVLKMQKHEMVAVHAGIWNEKRPVPPDKCGWHNRGCVWDKIATEWAVKEDWT